MSDPASELACPLFIAMAGDDFLDADADLDALLGAIRTDAAGHDVAIWHELESLVAVVLADGTVQRFEQRQMTSGK